MWRAVPHLAAIKQITQITMREAEVMTFNNLFEGIAVIFLVSLAVAPFLKKMDKKIGMIPDLMDAGGRAMQEQLPRWSNSKDNW